ncbi:hypothetical protein FQN57_005544 [Myotisia sp. PD_48]|nr:hypothetical protein FQN57_005544 [Myotisia sp. PD_48]
MACTAFLPNNDQSSITILVHSEPSHGGFQQPPSHLGNTKQKELPINSHSVQSFPTSGIDISTYAAPSEEQHGQFRAGNNTSDFLESSESSSSCNFSPESTGSVPSFTTTVASPAASIALTLGPASPRLPRGIKDAANKNMTDYRLQSVSALQTPGCLPPTMHSSGTVLPNSPGMMPRADAYHVPYQSTRSVYPNSNGLAMNNLSRYSNYPATRPIDMHSNHHQSSSIFGSSGNYLPDTPISRPSGSTGPEAPPFQETVVLHHLVINNQPVRPEINAKIHKGFFPVDGKWTCYRRNYFSLSCSFTLRPWMQMQNPTTYLQLANGTTQRVKSFSMAISAVVNGQEGEIRELVQHTPKRDKQSERRPGKVSLDPQPPPSLILNPGHMGNGHHMTFAMTSPPSSSMHFDCTPPFGSVGHPSQNVQSSPTSHTFERIQFQKATANNGKRRAQQQFYQLVTELYADIGEAGTKSSAPQWVMVARRLSYPMVVRGRSPGHYKDARRNSTTSIGPEDTGASCDSRMNNMGQSIVPSTRQHPPLLSYEQSQSRRMTGSDPPPLTASSLVSSSSSSPGFDFGIMNDSINPMESMKDTTGVDTYGQQSYTATSSSQRKSCAEPSGLRNHMSTFNDSITATKNQEQQDSSNFGETFEPMVSLLHNENDGANQYFHRQDDHGLRNGLKFHGSYSNRPTTHSYGRY